MVEKITLWGNIRCFLVKYLKIIVISRVQNVFYLILVSFPLTNSSETMPAREKKVSIVSPIPYDFQLKNPDFSNVNALRMCRVVLNFSFVITIQWYLLLKAVVLLWTSFVFLLLKARSKEGRLDLLWLFLQLTLWFYIFLFCSVEIYTFHPVFIWPDICVARLFVVLFVSLALL